ncbi:MAG: type II toxin-antitoxin system VapC family toxin [Chloroflexi bacterium]|nr:type II toxin-antitoxin system VapC family toxin [Chloroflexota bacterium]
MAARVLDSYALMAFFEDEPGADAVRNLLLKAEEGSPKLLMCVVNLGEVWYAIARTNSARVADEYIQEVEGMAIEIVDADWKLTRLAAEFKTSGNIAYADCYAAALAKSRKAELVTGDREFKTLEKEIRIDWL